MSTHDILAASTRRPFRGDDLDDLLRFIRAHPLATHNDSLLRTLLTTLPRSPDHVLDLHLAGQRALVACVVDTVRNTSDSAVLELLGLDAGPHTPALLTFALEAAQDLARSGPARCLEISLPGALTDHAACLLQRGYHVAYRQYHMIREGNPPPPPLRDCGLHFADADLADLPAYHALVAAAFAAVPGAQLSDLDTFRAMFEQTPRRPRLLFHGERLVGFVKTSLDPDGRTGLVNILGRDPASSGQRLGDILLAEAARVLLRDGAERIRLEVAVSNHNALGLYRRHGFMIVADLPTYQAAIQVS